MTPVHFSQLKAIALSPLHYKAALEHPKEQTPAMRLGSLIHAMVLGGEYKVWDGNRRGKDWEAFKATEGPQALIVTMAEVDKASAISDALIRHPVARQFLRGKHEVPVEWTENGRACASRGIDILGDDYVADLKSSTSVQPFRFMRACLRLAYHAQLAGYIEAMRQQGRLIRSAYIIGVETVYPHDVTVLRLTDRALDMGARMRRLWIERLLACEAANEWPGYAQSVVELDVNDDDETLVIDGEEVAA